jgi:N-acetylglucosaminyl-diphospho-decaprenol L-rhamnosyltransferase
VRKREAMTRPASPVGVSVVIPHYGDPAPAVALLDQLAEQRGAPPLQIVVVDDASPTPFPTEAAAGDVLVLRRTRNGGFGSAVNTGVARCAHPHLLILNSDVTIGETFVRDLLDAAGPWLPALVAPAVTTGGALEHTGRRFPTARHQLVERVSALARWRHRAWWQRAVGQDLRATRGRVVPVDWVAGVVMLLPTAEFREVGGFDERFHMYAEEVDLQRRLRERGIPSVLLGTVSVTHVGAASSDPDRRQRWLTESRLSYAEKWGGAARLRTALTTAAVTNLVVDVARRAAGRDVDPWSTAREDLGAVWDRSRSRQPFTAP